MAVTFSNQDKSIDKHLLPNGGAGKSHSLKTSLSQQVTNKPCQSIEICVSKNASHLKTLLFKKKMYEITLLYPMHYPNTNPNP